MVLKCLKHAYLVGRAHEIRPYLLWVETVRFCNFAVTALCNSLSSKTALQIVTVEFCKTVSDHCFITACRQGSKQGDFPVLASDKRW